MPDPHPQWLCPGGHVLGFVQEDADHVSYLVEYERAFRVGETPAAVRPGKVYEKLDCRCAICGAHKSFGMDRRKLDRLVARVLAQRQMIRNMEAR